ncbi:MAG: hypothetical protein WD577_08190 [Bacteroidales bacterium]
MNDTTNITFEVESKYGADFKLTNPSGFEIEENKTSMVWVKIDLPFLFEGIDLDMADKDSAGIIRINTRSNWELLETIISNLNTSSEIGLDHNLDGEIDD